MATWLLDANVVIYHITGHPDFQPRLAAAFRRAKAEGHALLLKPAVVAEVLYILEGRSFAFSREAASRALEAVVAAPEIECDEQQAVLLALARHRSEGLDFVDGYLSALAKEPGVALLTNDKGIQDANVVPW